MRTELRHSRVLRCCMLLSICALLLGLFPAQPARAAINKTLPVDNGLVDFSRGTFLRSALSTMVSSNSKMLDQRGAVQIAPVGTIKNWTTSSIELPRPLQRMGTAVYGNRLYVIAGQTNAGGTLTNVGEVWSNTVSTTSGALLKAQWDAEPSLNLLQSRLNDTRTFSQTSGVAVTLVPRSDNQGAYLYVLGGNISIGTVSFSSYTARLGTIGSDGRITGWTALPNIPSPDALAANQRGIQYGMATSYSVGGKTYVYLLGGEEAFYAGTGSGGTEQFVRATRKVYYAEVGANGRLFQPGTSTEGWSVMANGDIPALSDADGTNTGLFDASVMVADNTINAALYLVGGQRTSASVNLGTQPTYTALVRRALFQADGKLAWNPSQQAIDAPRFGTGGVAYRGKLYVTGGQIGSANEPSRTIQTSQVGDSLSLPTYGNINFLPADTIPEARLWHSSQVVGSSDKSGFVYVMGGRGPGTTGVPEASLISPKIFLATIGVKDDESQGFPETGRFYSAAYPIVIEGAEVKEINWSTVITPGANMDIQISIRTSNANSCNNPGWDESSWKPISSAQAQTGFSSANGINTYAITEQIVAKCFQYQVTMFSGKSGVSSLRDLSPSLLNLGIIVRVPGSPDLKVKSTASDPNAFRVLYNNAGKFSGLSVKLTNLNEQTTPPDNVTQDAAAESAGTFFVNLYIFKPGETVVPPQLPPVASNPDPVACVQIDKALLPAKAEYSIATWFVSDDSCDKTPYSFASTLTTAGTYTIYVAVDTDCFGGSNNYGCVNEQDALNGEANNISGPLTVTIKGPEDVGVPDTYLPLMKRFAK